MTQQKGQPPAWLARTMEVGKLAEETPGRYQEGELDRICSGETWERCVAAAFVGLSNALAQAYGGRKVVQRKAGQVWGLLYRALTVFYVWAYEAGRRDALAGGSGEDQAVGV